MKNTLFTLLTLLFATFLTSCGSDEKDEVKPQEFEFPDTNIELTVKNELGNSVSGASVKLYASSTDWENQTNQVGSTRFTDSYGKVLFEDVSSLQYYWYAEKDCRNNYNGAVTTKVTEGVTTKLDLILSETVKLNLKNTSANPYKVFINGKETLNMAGGSTEVIENLPAGPYSVRVLQISGYAFYPTEETYEEELDCGDTFTVIFP